MEFENLLTLIKAVSDSELTEFHYEENGTNIHFVKEQPQQIPVQIQTVAAAAPQAAAVTEAGNTGGETAAEPEGMIVKAPLVGTFYESDYSGKIAEIYVENGQAVEYGQPLFRIVNQ